MLKKIRKLKQKVLKGPIGTKVLVFCLLFVFGLLVMVEIPRYFLDLPDSLEDFLPIFFLVTFLYITRSEDSTMGSLFRRRDIREKDDE